MGPKLEVLFTVSASGHAADWIVSVQPITAMTPNLWQVEDVVGKLLTGLKCGASERALKAKLSDAVSGLMACREVSEWSVEFVAPERWHDRTGRTIAEA